MPRPTSSRSDQRSHWPVRVYRLGEEPGDDLSRETTAAERLAMVWELTARMWEFSGQQAPSYGRSQIPVRIIRPA